MQKRDKGVENAMRRSRREDGGKPIHWNKHRNDGRIQQKWHLWLLEAYKAEMMMRDKSNAGVAKWLNKSGSVESPRGGI